MMTFINQNAQAIIVWFGAACTLGIYSILYKENKIYRIFEHIFIGMAAGWGIRIYWTDILYPNWWARMTVEGRYWWFFAFPLGFMLYMVYSKKYNWMARLSIGVLLGLDAGQQFQKFSGLYYRQIGTTFKPLIPQGAQQTQLGPVKEVTWSAAVNNWIFLAIIVCVMTYFFFSFEQKNAVVKKTANLGRWMLMGAFGAIFGSTIMARMALFISRVDFLIHKFGAIFFPFLK